MLPVFNSSADSGGPPHIEGVLVFTTLFALLLIAFVVLHLQRAHDRSINRRSDRASASAPITTGKAPLNVDA